MAMYQGLDLSKFKKVSSNKDASTLRHAKGHEIKIAHAGISPKMREELGKLPVYMAEGGEIEADDGGDSGDDAAEVADSTESEPEVNDEETAPEEEPEAPVAPAPAEEPPVASPPPRPSINDGDVPQSNIFNVTGQRRVPTAQELDNEDALFAQDLQRGHIKPETIQDLYAKKDTLGKIGTLFGLLIAGAGSGLTGQPNAVMEMMKNEVANDLEAQKVSNANAQNWLRLSQQHELQKAQLGQMGIQNELTRAQIGKVPSEIEANKAHTALMKTETQVQALNAATNKMYLGIYQDLKNKVDKYPPGPTKDKASDVLENTVGPAVQNLISENNAKTAGTLGVSAALAGNGPKPSDPGIDLKKFSLLKQFGQVSAAKNLPGGIPPSEVHEVLDEAKGVAANRAFYRIWDDSFKRLNSAFRAGLLNPQLRQAEIATLGAQVARETAGRFNQAEASAQADAMFPSAEDFGKARGEKYRKGVEYFKGNEANTTLLDNYDLKTPFPGPPEKKKEAVAQNDKKKPAQSSKPVAPQTKSWGGKSWKRGPNGEAIEVK